MVVTKSTKPQDELKSEESILEEKEADLDELDDRIAQEYDGLEEKARNRDQPITMKVDATDWEEKYKRVLADYHNLEQRTQSERSQLVKMGNRWLMESLLEPIGFMEMATNHVTDPGIQMVVQKFQEVLDEYGLKEITVKAGQSFDEKTMEAIDTADGEEGKVIKVTAKGYQLHDQVIRHAKVVVGKN